jgi:high-affinity iron transporter
MLPTFVIGLREGLEAALIVGIIAAFLRKQGRRDLLRWVLIGVGVAIGLCVLAGVALKIYSQDLPQAQQEGLETIIGAVAVCMVTYMVIWMRRNSRNLKGQLEGLAADAIGGTSGAGRALVLMAFLAVIREGIETVVFVLAAFNESGNGAAAGTGLLLGIALAMALGYGIYRGGVRINLSKFFRATGLVLVLVAAGIVVNALHTAHEAGWLNLGQSSPLDLRWLVSPGSVQSSLLTGMLGVQPQPAVIEIVGWLLYLIPVGLYVAWPPSKAAPARLLARGGAALAALAGIAALLLAIIAPGTPEQRPTTGGGAATAQVVSRGADTAVVRTQVREPVRGTTGPVRDLRMTSAGTTRHLGVDAERFTLDVRGTGAHGRPTSLDPATVAQLNGGRLPIGLRATGALPATYPDLDTATVWLDTRTDRVLDVQWSERVLASVTSGLTTVTLDRPVAAGRAGLASAATSSAVSAARAAHADLEQRSRMHSIAWWCLALAVVAGIVALGFGLTRRRRPQAGPAPRPEAAVAARAPKSALIRH